MEDIYNDAFEDDLDIILRDYKPLDTDIERKLYIPDNGDINEKFNNIEVESTIIGDMTLIEEEALDTIEAHQDILSGDSLDDGDMIDSIISSNK